MCGISIAVNLLNRPISDELIRSINNSVAHRGPDDEGFYHKSNFAFGHRRLSIIDLSNAGHQPMQWKHLCITYNGEIYNYLELREELIALGYSFTSASDTEVILAAYHQWGTEAFSKFNGMWAFAIHDSLKNEIVFSRDHFGIKPLYFTRTESYFLAGSEIKQFTVVDGFKSILNKPVAVNFLINGWLNYSDQTFFEGVNELRPGHYLRYNLTTHQSDVKRWYDLPKASVPIQDTYEEAVEKVRSLFIDSVRIRMRSDVRVGSCLSGGIDSSAIIGIIHSQQLCNTDFATITSCYSDKRYDEQTFSDEVSLKTGFRAEKVFPNLNHLLDEGHLDKMIYHQDQPFSGASHYSEFKVFQTARENQMIVMQDGQGSDEFLCGYGEFYTTLILEMVRSFEWGNALRLWKVKAAHKNTSILKEIKLFIKSVYAPRFIRIIKKLTGKSDYPWLTESWRKIAKDSLINFEEKSIRELSLTEIEYSSIPYQLHSEDRNSMLFSIESRLPFLDPRLVEYCIGLPSSYKIKNGYTKAVLRDAISELPESIRLRKNKMGFVAPDPIWVIQNKERVRQDLQNVIQASDIFSADLVNRFDRFVNGELGYEPIYFRAMAFNRFCKIFSLTIN
jgi:asparagine synthase (glutamine-hydrolysing)